MKRRIRCYALTDKRGRFIQTHDPLVFQEFRALTFKTAKAAAKWIENDSYWRGNAFVTKVAVTIEEIGF